MDLWPVIADSFVGILAIYIFIAAGKPIDEKKEEYKEVLRERLTEEKKLGLIDAFTIDAGEACIVYSADALSFDSCTWDIPLKNAEKIREHMRWFGTEPQFIKRIQIEGHADNRRPDSCPDFGPYRDNLQLSQNRARAIYNILLGLAPTDRGGLARVLYDTTFAAPDGLGFVRLLNREGKLQTAGFGDTLPRDAANPLSAENRRVEIRIVFEEDSTATPESASAISSSSSS